MYSRYIKRPLDFCLALFAITVLSPVFIVLIVLGAVMMKGNPFFTQPRPGKNEKIFKLIKFRTMTCEKDKDGELLTDDVRLTKYGRFLRSTSLDELPELINILKGEMAIIGPRPLSVKYLGFYTERERHRHGILPGLTGLAQVSGRNAISWEEKFELDLQYIENITFINDLKILFLTVACVINRKNIGQGNESPISLHVLRAQEQKEEVFVNDN